MKLKPILSITGKMKIANVKNVLVLEFEMLTLAIARRREPRFPKMLIVIFFNPWINIYSYTEKI